MTCDDVIDAVYADGTSVGGDLDEGPYVTVHTIDIPSNTRIIAIQGSDRHGGRAGLAAIATNGYVTDDNMRCSDVFEEGWYDVGFDDSHWPAARDLGLDRESPFSEAKHPGIDESDAHWIWTKNDLGTAYCRGRYS